MSGQLSDWRERLHANPSRMEQELAIEHKRIKITFVTLSDPSRHENARSAIMILVLEKASAWWDYAWLTFKNPSSFFRRDYRLLHRSICKCRCFSKNCSELLWNLRCANSSAAKGPAIFGLRHNQGVSGT